MSAPQVSVVMPVLAPHPVFFRQAVESVLAQTLREIELVIVEDPSSTSAASLLADISDERLRLHTNDSRTSLVKQRNLGLAMARGPWIAMLDADDICEPHRLATQLAFVTENPTVDVLGSQLAIIDDTGRQRGFRRYPLHHDEIASALRRFNALGHSSVMVRRQLVLDAGGYCYDLHGAPEDYELWCRLLQRNAKFANHPAALVRYRIQPQQFKSTHLREALRGTIQVKMQYWSSEKDLRVRARIWAERLMLHLPPQIVLALFKWTQISSTLPASQGTSSKAI